MQKFLDRRGRVWIVDIDNTTLKRVKLLTDVRLLDAIDQGSDVISRLSTDPLLLGDVLFAYYLALWDLVIKADRSVD